MTSGATRRKVLIGGVAVAAAGAGAGGALWRQGGIGGSKSSELPPGFWETRFDRPDGGELKLESLKGKPLLINFWATWCPPCVEEMPMIDAFFRQNSPNGWQVLGLAIDQPSAVRKFLERTPVSYVVGLAGLDGTELVKSMGNSSGGLPFTVVVDPDGKVTARKMGKLEAAELDAWRRA